MQAPGSSSRLLLLLLLLTSLHLAVAKPKYISMLPNGAKVPALTALGHVNVNGSGALNSFGRAFIFSAREWSVELCNRDSDNDGQTNGQELGDPCCEWVVGDTPRFTTGISHPGDSTQTANASRWINLTCPEVTKLTLLSKSSAADRCYKHCTTFTVVVAVFLELVIGGDGGKI